MHIRQWIFLGTVCGLLVSLLALGHTQELQCDKNTYMPVVIKESFKTIMKSDVEKKPKLMERQNNLRRSATT